MNRVLIVEDEDHLAAGLKLNLEAEGYAADVEDTGEAALERLVDEGAAGAFDVVLLDVMLPGVDGFEVVRRLRAARQFVPVMLLTARSHTDDMLRGFEAGADDYLPKPFDLSILLARLQGLLRRRRWLQGAEAGQVPETDEYSFAGRHVDFRNQVLRRDRGEHPLTLMEATLLRYLVQHAGETVSRRTLLEEVWGVRQDTDTRTVDNFVARLRRYIEAEPAHPRHLLTVRGVGYRFVEEPDD